MTNNNVRKVLLGLSVILILAALALVSAAQLLASSYAIVPCGSAIVDGEISSGEWDSALVVPMYRAGKNDAQHPQESIAFLLYKDGVLYVRVENLQGVTTIQSDNDAFVKVDGNKLADGTDAPPNGFQPEFAYTDNGYELSGNVAEGVHDLDIHIQVEDGGSQTSALEGRSLLVKLECDNTTATNTLTPSSTATGTPSPTPSTTASSIPTVPTIPTLPGTSTPTPSATASSIPTIPTIPTLPGTPSSTPSATATSSPVPSVTPSATASLVPTAPPTVSPTATLQPSPTPKPSGQCGKAEVVVEDKNATFTIPISTNSTNGIAWSLYEVTSQGDVVVLNNQPINGTQISHTFQYKPGAVYKVIVKFEDGTEFLCTEFSTPTNIPEENEPTKRIFLPVIIDN